MELSQEKNQADKRIRPKYLIKKQRNMKHIKSILKWLFYIGAFLITAFFILLVLPEKETVQPIQPRENTRYWNMTGDFKIAYTHLESGDSIVKPPIVFIHGGPGGYVHSSIIELLGSLTSKGHDVFFYDQRGSGLSDRMERFSDVDFQHHLDDLHEIITRKIKAHKVILIGQSFGSIIAAHYSAVYPQHVDKIIFSSPGTLLPHLKINDEYADLTAVYPAPDSLDFIKPYHFVDDVNRMSMKPKAIVATLGAMLLNRKLVSDKQMDRMLNTLAAQFTKGMVCDPQNVLPEEGGGGLYAFLATNNGDLPEIRPTIKDLTIPVMVLQGQCEYHPFATAYEYVDLYPNSRYIFVENAGHEIWWEKPAVFLREISSFLDDTNRH
jgi:proline iminopeptidase